jgi:hypothetical protein
MRKSNGIILLMAQDTSLLEAALLGYQAEHARITAAVADIQSRLGKGGGGGVFPWKQSKPAKKRHVISAEGRARIAAAQKKRWAAAKKKS